MNYNYLDYYSNKKQKYNTDANNNLLLPNNNYKIINSVKRRTEGGEEDNYTNLNILKNTRKISDDNYQNKNQFQNIRYFTPLQSRYQNQSYDKIKNKDNNINNTDNKNILSPEINTNINLNKHNKYQYLEIEFSL